MRNGSALCWPLAGLALGCHCAPSAMGTHGTVFFPKQETLRLCEIHCRLFHATSLPPSISPYLLPLTSFYPSTVCQQCQSCTPSTRAFIAPKTPLRVLTVLHVLLLKQHKAEWALSAWFTTTPAAIPTLCDTLLYTGPVDVKYGL